MKLIKNNKMLNSLVKRIIIILLLQCCIFTVGCGESVIPANTAETGPTKGYLIIENNKEITEDSTPFLTIFSEGADYMSFSGDGEHWNEWIEYSTYYTDFCITSGFNGTEFNSGIKYVYVRFKDKGGNLSPENEYSFDTIEYEFGALYSIKIYPQEVTVPLGGSCTFALHGYDLKTNEVPLDSEKVIWTKCCGVGSLSNTTGLFTTYTAPYILGKRNISAQYNNLKTGAVIYIMGDN